MKYIIPTLLALGLIVLSSKYEVGKGILSRLGTTGNETAQVIDESRPITLTFVGDIMMDRGVKKSVIKNFAGDYAALYANTSYLKESDISFANLEGSVATGGHNVGSRFSFHMDPVSLGALKGSGIDIVSFANNHVGDYAKEGFLESLQNLRDNNLRYTGAGNSYAEVITPTIINVRGTKIGYLAATDVGPNWLAVTPFRQGSEGQEGGSPGILLASNPKLPDIITNAKSQVDILVMSFHWGNEYSPANAHQVKLAHTVIDAGADIVVGHHPHVMERVEEYGPFGSAQDKKPIFYSLGNFIFDQSFSIPTMHGMVAHVSIDPDTKAITTTREVSPLSKQFVPQTLIPFDTSMLVTKTFTP